MNQRHIENIGSLIRPEVLDHLHRLFPNQCPDLKATERDIWAAVGAQTVISYLQRQFDSVNQRDQAGDDISRANDDF